MLDYLKTMGKLATSSKAYKLLEKYNGDNPYIINLKNDVFAYNTKTLNTFECEYIIENHDYIPTNLNKVVKIASWYGQSLQEEFNLEFLPSKLQLGYMIGETKTFYHVYFRYRKSQEKMELKLVPKSAVLTALFVEDFANKVIDFTPYNEKSGMILQPHQEMSVKFLTTRKKGILALEMGLGKSLAAIVAALEDKYQKVLVVCPASLKTNWQRELQSLVDESDISIVNNKTWDEKPWTIINYDILDNFYSIPTEIKKVKQRYIKSNGTVGWKYVEKEIKSKDESVIQKSLEESQLFQGHYDLIIIDECHKLSNKTSGRYKIISDLIEKSKPSGLYLLTGTIMANNPTNYYNVLKLLNAEVTKDWVYYVKTYCGARQIHQKKERDAVSRTFVKKCGKESWYDLTTEEKNDLNRELDAKCRKIWIMGEPKNLDELQERTKHLYFRVTNESLQRQIKKNTRIIEYDLDENEQKLYDEAWKEYMKNCEEQGKEAKVDTKQLIEGTILRQVTANMMIPHTITLTKELIAKNEKVIIFCNFDSEVEALKEAFGDKSVVYNGKMNIKAKDTAIETFKNDDNCQVFIGNIIAAGVGINLICSRTIIFNSVSWVPSDNEQAEFRILRIGQTKDCDIIYQKLKNTYQERIFEILDLKTKTIDAVIVTEDKK